MDEDAEPVSYEGVRKGTPLLTSTGREFGTLERVLEIPEEDLFEGFEVRMGVGVRVVGRDQVAEITTRYIKCALDDAAVASLPKPSGSPVYKADPEEDSGTGFGSWLGRTFRHARWKQEDD